MTCPFASRLEGDSLNALLASDDPSQLFWKFHGPEGVVPLNRFDTTPSPSVCPIAAASLQAGKCPVSGATSSAEACPFAALHSPSSSSSLSAAPFASIGLRFNGFPFNFFKPQPRPKPQSSEGQPGARDGRARYRQNGAEGGVSSSNNTLEPTKGPSSAPSEQPSTSSSSSKFSNSSNSSNGASSNNPAGSATNANSNAHSSATPGGGPSSSSSSGRCPMRRFYEPAVAALTAVGMLGPKLQLQCPTVIVQARAALSKTPLATEIRRQILPKKLVAVGALSLLTNVPLGMIREHTEKFSWQWIVAVHASIPFVAMLRKATVLPKYSIAVTIASAVVGQAIGAALERQRLAGGSNGNKLQLAAAPGAGGCRGEAGVEGMGEAGGKLASRLPNSKRRGLSAGERFGGPLGGRSEMVDVAC